MTSASVSDGGAAADYVPVLSKRGSRSVRDPSSEHSSEPSPLREIPEEEEMGEDDFLQLPLDRQRQLGNMLGVRVGRGRAWLRKKHCRFTMALVLTLMWFLRDLGEALFAASELSGPNSSEAQADCPRGRRLPPPRAATGARDLKRLP